MTDQIDVFLSYSRNDVNEAVNLGNQLRKGGLGVFQDLESIRGGDLWLNRLQKAVDDCGSFVVLVGRDGVRRWIGAETQVALTRYFGPHDDAERLPIFPILLGDIAPDTLPAFLRLFQTTPWNGSDPLPQSLLNQIHARTSVANDTIAFEGCPFVGLDAFQFDQALLFFGRQKESLDALACFDTRPASSIVRWLEISGNSGSGKSSLMNAGLLPLVEQGWLWPRTGFEHWRRIGPMIPGERPVAMLAEQLARTFEQEMADIRQCLEGDWRGLADWLRGRKQPGTAFLLAIDQFEELFTSADPDERNRFDLLLACALEDADCPLFVISTVRTDFLDQFEDLPRLVTTRNRSARQWTLPPIDTDGLREIISGPARLACLDVSEVKEVMVAEAHDEPGALPLVQNALHWLWGQRTDNRLPGQLFSDKGGLAGILSHAADGLLQELDQPGAPAMELLFRLVKVDPEGRRHTRRRISLAEAVELAGESGRALIDRLAGTRASAGGHTRSPVRLITVTEGAEGRAAVGGDSWVNLIHETLIRSKGLDTAGKPQPYWPRLWNYIEEHMERAVLLKQLRADTQVWLEQQKPGSYQWTHERVRQVVAALDAFKEGVLNDQEREFLGPCDAHSMFTELDRPETTHRRRAFIGERLDVLGDPRSGVGVDSRGTPELEWYAVPGGEVAIAVSSYHKQVDSFHVARYPITVAQYRAFLEAENGWRNTEWWAEDLFRDPDDASYYLGRFGNYPVVYTNWFDAVAFCRWLSRRLNFTVRLPDEWAWQQAATGGDVGNLFPWGPDWDPEQQPNRANTNESKLGRIMAVGMYPAGSYPEGAQDMAGMVREWCLNKYDRPDVTASRADDFDARATRGGSWSSPRDDARCADRVRGNPKERNGNRGFRVVCSSPTVDPGHEA